MNTIEATLQTRPLPRAEALTLEAAEGWLMLGKPDEACAELEKVPPDFWRHPQVLTAWCQVFAGARLWEAA